MTNPDHPLARVGFEIECRTALAMMLDAIQPHMAPETPLVEVETAVQYSFGFAMRFLAHTLVKDNPDDPYFQGVSHRLIETAISLENINLNE